MTAEVAYRHQGRAAFPRLQKLAPAEDPRFDQRALCRLGTAVLFDEKGAGEPLDAYRQRRKRARSLCRDCPVQATCLGFGEANKLSGFMGGVELVRGTPRPGRR